MKRGSVLAAVLLVCAPASRGQAQDRYFPAETARDADHAAFREEWFGRRLRAMGEPILFGPSARAGFSRRLRLLVRPYRRPAYSIRIDEDARRGLLTFVELDTAAFTRPGLVARRRVSTLTRAQRAEIGRLLDRSELASLPAEAPEHPPRILPNGMQEIEMCVHSTYFVLELVDAAGSHLVERDPCNLTSEVAALADRLIALRPRGASNDRAVLAEQMRRRD